MKRIVPHFTVAAVALALAAGQCLAELRAVPEGASPAPRNPKQDVARIGDRPVGKGVNFYSIEKEIEMGRKLADEIEQAARIVEDPGIAEFVNRIGQNIARSSDSKVPLAIKVIDSEEVNAFALPGGFLYVNTGLIELAEDEAELAGVMAHEVAHVAARHSTRSATRAQLSQFATLPLVFIGGWAGYGAQQAAKFAIPMTMLKFSRDFEREADLLGVQYMYEAGYDPASMVQFFERLQAMKKKNENVIARAFGSHPLTKSRIRHVQEAIDKILPERAQYAVTTSEFQEVKDRIARINARRKPTAEDPDRPTLRRRNGEEPVLPGDPDAEAAEAERPTLTRRHAS